MIWALVEIGILAVSLIASYYLRPEEERKRAASLNDLDFPRAEEGDAIPLAYGTVRINSPIVIQYKLDGADPRESNGSFLGFRYQVALRLLLCRSNVRVDQSNAPQAQFIKLYIGDSEAVLTGPEVFPSDDPDGVATYRATGAADDVFDGSTNGYLIFYDGRWDIDRIDRDVDDGVDGGGGHTVALADRVPYRGYVTLRLWRWIFDGEQMATTSAVIFNPCVIPGYESSTGAIAGSLQTSDCNPAAVIYDLITNPWGGIGSDDAMVDAASFVAAAATLESEGHGCSLLVTNPNEARSVIAELLRQIDGVLYQDFDSNAYVLKLVREDYNPATLPEYTMSNVLEAPEMPSTLWSETYNQVRVVFTDPQASYRQSVATEQDLAGIAINGGRVRSQEIRFPGCRNPDLAQKLAARELNFFSRPIYTIKLVVNRQAWNLKPGDPFRFTWGEWGGLTVIFRVTQIDLGELDAGRITITGVQDRFSIVGTVFDPPIIDTLQDPPLTPSPILDRLVTEAPRWIQVQAFDQGLVANPESQRTYALARPEGIATRYRLNTTVNAADELTDLSPRVFPTTFTLAASYAKSAGPYDTVTGILIENVDGTGLGSATATQIREEGRNLIALWDDDGNHEILAYEAAADLGGGSYQLQNVWRGLLDTVPQSWAGGASGAVLPGTGGVDALGKLTLRYGATVATSMPAAYQSAWTPASISPVDGFTAASRVLHPVRPANLLVSGSQAPAALEEEDATVSFAIRNRTTAQVVRGDAAAESAESGQTYDAVAYKGTGSQVVLVTGHTSSTTTQVPLGKVGHGSIELGADTKRTVTLPDGTTPTLRGWQVPTVPIVASHWRNLLRNPRFAGYAGTGGLDAWTTVGGTPQVGSTAGQTLGGSGYYVRGLAAAGTTTLQQDVDVSGYPAHGSTAVLNFYARKLTDSVAPDDTVTVTLYALDSGGSTVDSTTYGPSSPTTWSRQALTLSALDATVTTLRVRIVLTAVGGGDSDADAGVTELCLRLGQISSQLLSNPSFESGGGSLASWTQTTSTWSVYAVAYESSYYTQPDAAGSAQLQQTVSLPAGHELGVAVLECARANSDVDDTGEVVLEALDGGGSVVASATTGDEEIAGTMTWERRRLVIDPIPATATDLRVTLNATRVTGGPLNVTFDDFDLRTHKHLDADQEQTWEWSTMTVQALPRTAMEWAGVYPTIDPPDYAIYDGTATGRLGIEPLLQVPPGAVGGMLAGKAIAYDGTNASTTAYEGYDSGGDGRIETAASGTVFGNFASADSFTVLAFVKLRADAPLGDGFGVCGRTIGGIGWEIRVTDTDGFPLVRVTGDGGSASVTGPTTIADGALHAIAMVYNGGASTLRLIATGYTASTSTAAIGELASTTPGKLRILWAAEAEAALLVGQVARVYLWRSAMATADVQELMTYPSMRDLADHGRTGTVACVVGSDTAGVVVDSFPSDRAAVIYDTASSRYGLVSMPAATNLATGVTPTDTGTVEANAATGPAGFYDAIRIEGDSTEGRTLDLATIDTVPATVYVSFLARAATAHDMRVTLYNGNIPGDDDTAAVTLTTTWAAYSVELAWSAVFGLDTSGSVRFSASDDGTTREIYLSPVLSISLVKPYPGTFPIGSPGATTPQLAVTLTNQLNREGEVVAEVASLDADACIADLHNGTNDNDRRTVSFDSDVTTPKVKSDHYTSAGVVSTAAEISGTAIDPTAPWEARLRWNRASTLDGASYYVDVRATQGATVEQDQGRNATWTASTTAVDVLELGHKADGSAVMAGVVFSAEVRAREEKLDPP